MRTASSDFANTAGDEVEFDFDSRAGDIAEGATAIPANFIVDGRVQGYLVNASGARVTLIVTAVCRVRN
jgi:cytidylate kinase